MNLKKLKILLQPESSCRLFVPNPRCSKINCQSMVKRFQRRLQLLLFKIWLISIIGAGNFEIPALEAMLEGLRMQGSWEGPIDWNDVIDSSFLPSDLQ